MKAISSVSKNVSICASKRALAGVFTRHGQTRRVAAGQTTLSLQIPLSVVVSHPVTLSVSSRRNG